MDAWTAAFALVIGQLCIALVMSGVHFAARPERCIKYWAAATIAVAAGVLLVVFGVRFAQPALQLAGNAGLVAAAILQWRGIQVFYGAPPSRAGWAIGAAFVVSWLALQLGHASTFHRITLLSATLLLVLLLSSRALLLGIDRRWSFGSVLTLGAITLLMVNDSIRIAASITRQPEFLPLTRAPGAVVILYLVPLGGIFLYTSGLLLLYFERVVERKNHLAMHDDLTGALNRRAIVAVGEREVAVAIRYARPLTVAFVDIDFFKRVNDSHGHEAGDIVLVDVARLLQDVGRSIDLVGRHGGEEFCLLFPGADADCAPLLGERLLAAIRGHRFEGGHQLTVSIGFASLADAGGERSWANLIRRADVALYRAKQLGRDRYCIASQDPAPGASDAAALDAATGVPLQP